MLTQKTQYALRAVFELASHFREGPMKIALIAEAQAIPQRFLEIILYELKQVGHVRARRGSRGGYQLSRSPDELTVGEILRCIQGPMGPVSCVEDGSERDCRLYSKCVFMPLWKRVEKAMSDIYDTTTFQDLIDQGRQLSCQWASLKEQDTIPR